MPISDVTSTDDGMRTRIVAGVVDVVVIRASPLPKSTRPLGRASTSNPWDVLTLRRGLNTRCTGAWEIVHGRMEKGERAQDAAVREVKEETGLSVQRLYNITVTAFYLHQITTIQMALVFAAVVNDDGITIGSEHDASKWRTLSAASKILAWPREREALAHVRQLLRDGDAGPVEDVLRIF